MRIFAVNALNEDLIRYISIDKLTILWLLIDRTIWILTKSNQNKIQKEFLFLFSTRSKERMTVRRDVKQKSPHTQQAINKSIQINNKVISLITNTFRMKRAFE